MEHSECEADDDNQQLWRKACMKPVAAKSMYEALGGEKHFRSPWGRSPSQRELPATSATDYDASPTPKGSDEGRSPACCQTGLHTWCTHEQHAAQRPYSGDPRAAARSAPQHPVAHNMICAAPGVTACHPIPWEDDQHGLRAGAPCWVCRSCLYALSGCLRPAHGALEVWAILPNAVDRH